MTLTTKHIIETLQKFTPCDVSDALVKFGYKNGGYFPNLVRQSQGKSSSPNTVVGKAYTVLFAPYDDPNPQIGGGYIDSLPEDSVLVIATTPALQLPQAPYTKVNNALYGGLMSTRAQYLKSKGTVVFGRIRDLAEHRQLEHPVFSYGVGSTAHKPVVKIIGINIPVDVLVEGYPEAEFQTINPGDIVVADENGVVRIPQEEKLLAKVLDFIPRRVSADELVAQDIKEGKPAAESQKLRRSAV
ncbi:hypothetical protein PP7435_CHR2-1352 [Komagataella phaffii CBS 7435]|uniref:4-hydroxy-4-methyl-2-oxoglutarate aldolase n=2 Tax=Komagataella phaffii TaxID=460519 RepID=C4R2X8_KOMPG|nr:uncharacterized protein PAS_chr2-2_0458 [Komagataella phaffii GS115]AOA61942.1 GQ67_01269T0 [Komagataella phaffii]CAH2447591.1 hypothetical protein BQ9382_C2-0435 [Komagataella phaffii CBS 7435]AOA67942.1 GQ68_00121T0 [Komagataella phaffii GS115]CAY69852.1 hypothetical protein PAS_chr2-2_0458 [Komagataella phaffii GS115]SCV11963.1 hypothetical protein PP7435_CHR2-1352 [Komagataella phaffii CBS 7435]